MAKITGPLMSSEASGTIGERLTFSKRTSGQQARFQKAQKDVNTSAQQTHRAKYTIAVNAWRALTTIQKDVYNERAKNLNMSGYNLYIKENINPVAPTIFELVSARIEQVTFGNYLIYLHFSMEPSISNLDGIEFYVNGSSPIPINSIIDITSTDIVFDTGEMDIYSSEVITFNYADNEGTIRSSTGNIPLGPYFDYVLTNNIPEQ